MVSMVQVRMARAALGWTVKELAERSGVHKNTILRLEAGLPAQNATVRIVQRTLEDAGLEFILAEEGVGGPGVRLKWGVDEGRLLGAAQMRQEGDTGGGLSSMGWEGEEELTDEDADLPRHILEDRAYWAANPEAWERLSPAGKKVLSKHLSL